METRERSHSVPALKLYKTMPGYAGEGYHTSGMDSYEAGKAKLLRALKSRDFLLSKLYKSNTDRQRYKAESAPKVFHRSNGSRQIKNSPLLKALKSRGGREGSAKELGGVRSMKLKKSKSLRSLRRRPKRQSDFFSKRGAQTNLDGSDPFSMMKATKLASHHGIWQEAKSMKPGDMSFLIDNRVKPKSLPSAKYTPFPQSYPSNSTFGVSQNVRQVHELNPLPSNMVEMQESEYPIPPTPLDKRLRKPKFVLGTARQQHYMPGHYRDPKFVPQGRLTRILGPAVPNWKSTMERKTQTMSVQEWLDFRYKVWNTEAAGGSGGDLGRSKRDTNELADLMTTKGYRYGEILRNAKLEQNDREDEMTIHGVKRGEMVKRR